MMCVAYCVTRSNVKLGTRLARCNPTVYKVTARLLQISSKGLKRLVIQCWSVIPPLSHVRAVAQCSAMIPSVNEIDQAPQLRTVLASDFAASITAGACQGAVINSPYHPTALTSACCTSWGCSSRWGRGGGGGGNFSERGRGGIMQHRLVSVYSSSGSCQADGGGLSV